MNPYLILAILTACTLLFATIVAGLTLLGVPLMVAFVVVYCVGLWFLFSMKRRAQPFPDFQMPMGFQPDRRGLGAVSPVFEGGDYGGSSISTASMNDSEMHAAASPRQASANQGSANQGASEQLRNQNTGGRTVAS